MNDGPKENDYKFCPGCGKPVTLAGDEQTASVEPEELKALASATGSAATAEYIRGVTAACEWLEKYKLTEEEEKDGVSWQRDCPQTFAWLIRTELLPPNASNSATGDRGASPAKADGKA